MELCDSCLEKDMEKAAMPARAIALLTHQMQGVFSFLHSNRIIHRDVKPSNILTKRKIVNGRRGNLDRPWSRNFRIVFKICDFGYVSFLEKAAEAHTCRIVRF